jgi:hypothetical protein
MNETKSQNMPFITLQVFRLQCSLRPGSSHSGVSHANAVRQQPAILRQQQMAMALGPDFEPIACNKPGVGF